MEAAGVICEYNPFHAGHQDVYKRQANYKPKFLRFFRKGIEIMDNLV